MSNEIFEPSVTTDFSSAWKTNLEVAICENCDWSYLLPPGRLPIHCPHCFQAQLTSLGGQDGSLAYNRPPELLLPFTVSNEQVARSIQDFAGGIWFAPGDLNPENLQERLQRIYLPVWLVDNDVRANWQAEVGFNYDAVSHRDAFDENRGGWISQQITETRIRWEPRLGRLNRTYHNTVAPALEEHIQLQRELGQYNIKAAQPYQTEAIANAFIRLPNRLPDDAWPEAIPRIQAAAAEECRHASSADHVREFRWTAQYDNLNWTLLLLPMYVSYYLDDDKNPQSVLIHGQSGQLNGRRRASMKRALRAAFYVIAVAVVLFILALIIALISITIPSLLLVAGIGLVIALIVGLGAVVPVVIAWQYNRTN